MEYCDYEDDNWPDEEVIDKLRKAIDDELPDFTKRIVRFRFNRRMSYKEIAGLLSVSEVTVYKHLHHAISVLRKKIKDHEG